MANINYDGNVFGNIKLADGTFIKLTHPAWIDNRSYGDATWFANGYLSTEIANEETGATVLVQWESSGADEAEGDADWDNPVSAKHYRLGELTMA